MKKFLLAVMMLASGAAWAGAESPEEAARGILRRYKDAVVTVRLVVVQRISIGGQDQKAENRTETIGTIVDPSGLTVVSLSAIDPSKTLGNMIRARAARAGQSVEFNIESDVTEADVMTADGTDIPAQVVLRDKELDLAFLRPKQKLEKPLVAVDIAGDPKAAMLEQLVCLNRLGKVANRASSVSLERVNAIVERPRLFYILGLGQGTSGVGSPVFTTDGKLLGMMLIRSITPEREGNLGSMFSGSESMGIIPIVVPAADVRDGVKQALAKAAEEPAKAPAPPAKSE
jgi:hypothetical protein